MYSSLVSFACTVKVNSFASATKKRAIQKKGKYLERNSVYGPTVFNSLKFPKQ